MSDRAAERKAEAKALSVELSRGNYAVRDGTDQTSTWQVLIERALAAAEDAAVAQEREDTRKLRALAQRIDAFECECEEIDGCAPCIACEATEALR